jgi:hypothetical protein
MQNHVLVIITILKFDKLESTTHIYNIIIISLSCKFAKLACLLEYIIVSVILGMNTAERSLAGQIWL